MKNSYHLLVSELNIFRQHSGEENIHRYLTNYDQVPNSQQLNISDLDVITLIYHHDDSRISDLLAHTTITQGAVSKIATRLTKLGFVSKSHHPNNKKETYLTLTQFGKIIATIHQQYHEDNDQALQTVMSKYSNAEIMTFTSLLKEINQIRQDH